MLIHIHIYIYTSIHIYIYTYICIIICTYVCAYINVQKESRADHVHTIGVAEETSYAETPQMLAWKSGSCNQVMSSRILSRNRKS